MTATRIRKFFIHSAIFGIAFLAVFIFVTNSIIGSYGSAIINDINALPKWDTAIIFGGGMKHDGSMSDMQEDRVKLGIELYKTGKASKLLMTGDDGAFRVNEVDAMFKYAVDNGVPPADVLVDPNGYRTYQSCLRAKTVFKLDRAIAVSQLFHLPRIIYLCKFFGIDTVGSPSEFRIAPWPRIKNAVREVLARTKAFIDVEFVRIYSIFTSTSLL